MIRRLVFFAFLLALLTPMPVAAQAWGDMADVGVNVSPRGTERVGKRAAVRFESETVEAAFNGVVAQGFAVGDNLEGWIRFQEGSAWGAWQPLYLVRSATDAAFLAAYRGEVIYQGRAFELRFDVDPGEGVDLLGAGVFDTRRDADALRGEAPPLPRLAPESASDFVIVAPHLNARSDWGAAPFDGTPVPLNQPAYRYVTFHHAAGFGATTRAEGLRQVKNIQTFHQNGRGWSDIGYQFVMDQSGRLYQGRPFLRSGTPFAEGPPLVQGAHVGGANTGNIGVCVLGCYHPPEGANCQDRMTEAALDSLVTMFAYLSERYGVPPTSFRGHRDFSPTACPGDNNYGLLPIIRERVEELLRTGNRPLGAASLAATVTDGGVVQLDWTFLEDAGIASYRIERVYGEGEATVVFEGAAVEDAAATDTELRRLGSVTYRLVARGGTGREQILAVATLFVEAPETYVLAQGFPNPFQNTATVRYYLEDDGLVSLDVYDVTGRVVATLVDQFEDGGRWHTAPFHAGRLSSGTYYVRLRVEGFSSIVYDKTRSLVLLR